MEIYFFRSRCTGCFGRTGVDKRQAASTNFHVEWRRKGKSCLGHVCTQAKQLGWHVFNIDLFVYFLLDSVEALSEALSGWGEDTGAIVVISHDKAFCEKVGFTMWQPFKMEA